MCGVDLVRWLDPTTKEPEAAPHATPESEIEAVTVSAWRYRELVEG
jgi:hypothetical protein